MFCNKLNSIFNKLKSSFMKQFYLTTVLLLSFVCHSTAQFNYQYFDGADTSVWNSILIDIDTASQNVWQIGTPQKSIFNSAATQPNAIVTDTVNFYPANNTSRFIAKVYMQFGNWGIFALQWKQKLDLDTAFDGGIIEYSTDTGNSWVNVFNTPFVYNFYGFQPTNQDTLAGGEIAFSGTDTTWRDIWLCFDLSWLQQFQFNDTILFRFTLLSDSVNNNKEGWMIDNMLAHITWIHTVNEVEQENYLNVFPNPANNIVHLQARKIMDYHIIETMELVDPLGRIIDRWVNIPTKFWFDTSKYNEGMYFLKVKTNLQSEMLPIVISKR
jgi:Secretion system C-terminal sorting domain